MSKHTNDSDVEIVAPRENPLSMDITRFPKTAV